MPTKPLGQFSLLSRPTSSTTPNIRSLLAAIIRKKSNYTMPSEQSQSQSQLQTRPTFGGHRSTTNSGSDSPYGSPHGTGKHKSHGPGHKHVVGGGRGAHTRIPSSKGLHKLAGSKVHIATENSHTDLKKLAHNSSATSLKKNSSHVSLKRNRSTADIPKRQKSSHGSEKRPASVHFEIGDQNDDSVEWEEASSASPALSRAVSSGKVSANSSEPQSPSRSPPRSQTSVANGPGERPAARHSSADAKAITERLLQRTPSYNTTKMSLATATPDTHHAPDSPEKSLGFTVNGTPKTGSSNEVVSRFVGGSGTPSENSPFLQSRRSEKQHIEEVKRVHSMGNLTRPDSDGDDDEESALAPRSRKSSTTNPYVPPQQSRTQQKLWLQRASSNMEPQQIGPGLPITGLHAGMSGMSGIQGTSLVGAGYDGRDPRIKLQLERTGLEYLVVRRFQDPVGKSLKRLAQLPGAEKNRRIPPQSSKSTDGVNAGRYGLSQSLKENRAKGQTPPAHGSGSSYEGQAGSQDDAGMGGRANDDDGAGAILRSMWEKSFDLSASAD